MKILINFVNFTICRSSLTISNDDTLPDVPPRRIRAPADASRLQPLCPVWISRPASSTSAVWTVPDAASVPGLSSTGRRLSAVPRNSMAPVNYVQWGMRHSNIIFAYTRCGIWQTTCTNMSMYLVISSQTWMLWSTLYISIVIHKVFEYGLYCEFHKIIIFCDCLFVALGELVDALWPANENKCLKLCEHYFYCL